MIFLVSVIQEKILCLVDGSRLDKYAEVLICRFVYRILPRIYIHSPQNFLLNYWNAKILKNTNLLIIF